MCTKNEYNFKTFMNFHVCFPVQNVLILQNKRTLFFSNIGSMSFFSSSGMQQSHHPLGAQATGINFSFNSFFTCFPFFKFNITSQKSVNIFYTSEKYMSLLDWKLTQILWQNFVDFINSYSMIFTLNPFHRMSETFFIQKNIFILLWIIVATTFLFTSFTFICSLLPNANTYLASIRKILQLQHQLFHLRFYQALICLNYHNILT